MFLIRFFFAAFITLAVTVAVNAQQKTPIDNSIVRESETFENTLQATWPTKGKDAKTWKAEGTKASAANDHRSGTGFFASSALLDKKNADTWLHLAREYLAIETDKYSEKSTFARNASSSAYIAYTRSQTSEAKAEALAVLAESLGARDQWRPALRIYKMSLGLVADTDVQEAYDAAFNEHGFRMLDYTSDNESNAPRICVQFSEDLAKGRIDFTNYVTVNNEKPASVRVQGSQLCVEDLLHGKRYEVKVRSGIPSTEDDLLPKPVELTVYIRDRSPSVRFSARNYVLPRTGQQGIPIVSINTKLVKATIYRIGDRRLAEEVLDGDFQKPMQTYQLNQLANQKGEKLWSGEMPVASKLNEEVTTAFPVDTLLPNLKPGLYVIAASAAEEGAKPDNDSDADSDYSTKTTQWFVVSDLGLTAFSGADGVHVYVRSLGAASPAADTEIRLVARNNEVLGTAKTDAHGVATFESALTHGVGGLAPALVIARGADSDYGFLDITKQAFDLSDRGVGGRTPPGPLDAMLFTERGVYRPGENVYITALLRDAGCERRRLHAADCEAVPPRWRRRPARNACRPGQWRPQLADRAAGYGHDGLLAACGLCRSEGSRALREDLPRRGLRSRASGDEADRVAACDRGWLSGHHRPCWPLPLWCACLKPRPRRRNVDFRIERSQRFFRLPGGPRNREVHRPSARSLRRCRTRTGPARHPFPSLCPICRKPRSLWPPTLSSACVSRADACSPTRSR